MTVRPAPGTDAPAGFTVLRALDGKRLAKRIRQAGDGPIEIDDYDKAYEFTATPVSVATTRDLYHRLAELQDEPHAAIVRGAIAEGANADRMRRLAHEKADAAPTLVDVKREIGFFDFEPELTDEEARRVQVVSDPDGAVDFALELGPPEFRACDLVWSYGASAGIKPRKLSLHFAAFLDRKVLGADLKATVEKWNAEAGRLLFDSSIYGSQSVIYTARPTFEGDAIDPLEGCRIGYRNGTGRPLALPVAGTAPPPPAPGPGDPIDGEAPEAIALTLVAELVGRASWEMVAGKRTRQDICTGVFTQLRDCRVRQEFALGAARALCKAGNDPDVLRVHGGRRKLLSWFLDFVPSIYGTAPREPRHDVADAIRAAGESAPLFFTAADELRLRSPLGPAVPTRLPTLDEYLEGGFRSGTHCVLVGPPESGKTTFSGHITVCWLDASAQHAVLVYARDEAPGAYINRLAQHRGFDRTALRQNDPATCARAAEALEERWGDRIQFLDPFRAPLDALLEKAAEMRKGGPLLVVVDSLQVAQTIAGAKASGQKDRIDAAMALGSELAARGDLVLSLSQSSRAGYAEPKNGRDPRAEGSGSAGIEFNADVLLGFTSKADDDPTAPRTVTVRKGRGGLAKGTVSFVVDRETTDIHEVDRDAAEESEHHAAEAKLRPYQDALLAELRKAAAAGEKRSGRYLEQNVPGGTPAIRKALKALVVAKAVFMEDGPRGALLYYAPTSPDLAPTSPRARSSTTETATSPPRPLP